MKRKKRKNQRWKLPVFPLYVRIILYLACVIAAAGTMAENVYDVLPPAAENGLYVCAAVLLVLAGICACYDLRARVWKNLLARIDSNAVTSRIYRDYSYRTLVTTLPSLAVNLAYTVYNGVFGILNRSAWFITMAVYYALLCGMRFLAVREKNRADRMENRERALNLERSVLKKDGILLLCMTVALSGMIRLTISDNTISASTDIMAITIAAYTFYKFIQAGINMIRVRKMKSPILISIRNIGFTDALVSVISLQNVLILSFEKEDKGQFLEIMNAGVGMVVCVIIVVMGIRMILMARDY